MKYVVYTTVVAVSLYMVTQLVSSVSSAIRSEVKLVHKSLGV